MYDPIDPTLAHYIGDRYRMWMTDDHTDDPILATLRGISSSGEIWFMEAADGVLYTAPTANIAESHEITLPASRAMRLTRADNGGFFLEVGEALWNVDISEVNGEIRIRPTDPSYCFNFASPEPEETISQRLLNVGVFNSGSELSPPSWRLLHGAAYLIEDALAFIAEEVGDHEQSGYWTEVSRETVDDIFARAGLESPYGDDASEDEEDEPRHSPAPSDPTRAPARLLKVVQYRLARSEDVASLLAFNPMIHSALDFSALDGDDRAPMEVIFPLSDETGREIALAGWEASEHPIADLRQGEFEIHMIGRIPESEFDGSRPHYWGRTESGNVLLFGWK